ncbi:MAG: hypothetical protein M3P93_13055 [Actinomycetota bacterium]|nr:hypothetical protein [Actinomycetota bacterium]
MRRVVSLLALLGVAGFIARKLRGAPFAAPGAGLAGLPGGEVERAPLPPASAMDIATEFEMQQRP